MMGSRQQAKLIDPFERQREFHLVLIKPTHYDDDGYPIQWVRSAIPSNTLACLNGLAMDARRRNILGPDVNIQLHTYDETNRRMRPEKIIRMIRNGGRKALIALVGVQSNQFPRAVDLARPFLAAGLPVCIGGFHISGCIAMLPELPQDMREAQALGISFFAGEAVIKRKDNFLPANEARASFEIWCRAAGLIPVNATIFGRRMTSLNFKRKKVGGSMRYEGVALRGEQPAIRMVVSN